MEGRGEKVALNSAVSILSQLVALISAFILPRLIIVSFGSAYNGITSSVSQFLSVIALLRGGVGGATRAALYRAFANKDYAQINATVRATELFMRKVACIFAGFLVVFAAAYPILVRDEFGWLFSASLVLIISVSTFVQYFFGITYQFLLQADQRQYITTLIDICAVILNVILSVVLIKSGVGIHGVKLGSALAFSIVPIALNIYCRKYYNIRKDVEPDFSSIEQRWDAFFHQVAAFVHSNTDIAILTIFSSQKIISVYTTYYLVGNGLRKIIGTVSTGVEAAFGNIIAKDEHQTLNTDLIMYETMLHILVSILFSAAFLLVTPFVMVYTRGVTDISYDRLSFGYIMIVSEMLFCLKQPYESIINAAGHFKQTKKYAVIEAAINLAVSLVLIQTFDLVGVVIGTAVSVLFRITVSEYYADRFIVKRSTLVGIKRFLVTTVCLAVIVHTGSLLPAPRMDSYRNWILYAIPVTLISAFVTLGINLLFYRKDMLLTFKKTTDILKRFIKTHT